jgi:DNA-binding NarL/FixJ family response regulator
MKYSIIHADRDFRFYEKLKNELAGHDEFEFLDHCCYFDSALQSLNTHDPLILITASKLYDEPKAVEAFCDYRDASMPNLKIIVLTSKDDLDHFLNSVAAGVEGYISKSCSTDEVYRCLYNVANGDNYLGLQKQVISKK